MKWARFRSKDGRTGFGVFDGERIAEYDGDMFGAPRADIGLVGSGLIVVNPPFVLERELQTLVPALRNLLLPDATWRLDWLAREQTTTDSRG